MDLLVAFAIGGTVLGMSALGMDVGNRLLGSGAKCRLGSGACIAILVGACLLLAVPACVMCALPHSDAARLSGAAGGALGVLFFMHYLLPYRFGVRREPRAEAAGPTRSLAGPVVLRQVTVRPPMLPPAAEGLKLLLVSDLHCNSAAHIETLQDCARALEEMISASPEVLPDLVCICGDLGENESLLPDVVGVLASLPSRHGAFCVLGNHDLGRGRDERLRELLSGSAITLLANEAHALAELDLALVGLEAPVKASSLPEVPDCAFRISLSHTADNIGLLRGMGVDLALAGHTHGGRFRLPVLRALFIPCWHGRFLDLGLFRLGDTRLYIGGGVGFFSVGMQAMGEIVLLTLTS